jgi:hypothetical protein
MATEPSTQAIEPSPQSDEQPPPLSPRVVAGIVGWFFCWPVVFFTWLPFVVKPVDTLEACLLGGGSLLWFMSCFAVGGLLFDMAEARWPAVKTIRKIMGVVVVILVVILEVLRAFAS